MRIELSALTSACFMGVLILKLAENLKNKVLGQKNKTINISGRNVVNFFFLPRHHQISIRFRCYRSESKGFFMDTNVLIVVGPKFLT